MNPDEVVKNADMLLAKILWNNMIVLRRVASHLIPFSTPTLLQFVPWVNANLKQGDTFFRIGEALEKSLKAGAEFRSDEAQALYNTLRYTNYSYP
jgi:hypothetical protein